MNELIKKLAEQSGFHFYNMHDTIVLLNLQK